MNRRGRAVLLAAASVFFAALPVEFGSWLYRAWRLPKIENQWGALNTPLESASLNILANVLQDGVWAQKSDSDYLLPKLDLGRIMAEPALGRLKKSGGLKISGRVF